MIRQTEVDGRRKSRPRGGGQLMDGRWEKNYVDGKRRVRLKMSGVYSV